MDPTPVYDHDHDPDPPPRPAETWSAIALRSRHGEFLSACSGYRVKPSRTPFAIQWFGNLAELGKWLILRSNLFRVSLDAEGYVPVRLTVAVSEVPLAGPIEATSPATRPIVAEAVVAP